MKARLAVAALIFAAGFTTFAGTASAQGAATAKPSVSPSPTPTPGPPFANMSWREIGPATAGGRIAAVAGSATDPKLYVVGSAGGGVWKTDNSGQTWDPIFEKEPVAAIGAVTIDPTDNKTIWVGTGEENPRNDVSYGDGVYKSTDGGEHWTNVGLAPTKQISRILVDPTDHNHVIVGALGDLFNDSPDRGVYVTEDGGKTWSKTLYTGPEAGVSDMAMDPQHPNVVYAGMWQFQRRPWTFTSGGPQDGLFKSTDGGKTWTKLTGNGLPTDTIGRIGLAVAPSDGNRVYALIESKQGILWRSDDAGGKWTMVSDNTLVDQRPFYFTHLGVDPKNPDIVYGVSEALSKSTDGGKTFKEIADQVHVDYHAIWIAPNDGSRIITGEDGGYALTLDGGDNWFFSANLPIAQVYRVGLSNENPYWVCGGLQDNNGWCAPNNSQDPSGIQNKAWIAVTGGDGEWTVPDPVDPNYIWADSENGVVTVINKVTRDSWFVQPYLQMAAESFDNRVAKVRFNWETPIAFAPWDGHIAWVGGNVLFQSTDRGLHWKVISPDLTRNVKAHQAPSGGPVTHDVSGAEESDTILDIEGSKLHKGEIWVGTDDGLIQLTRDGGKHWKNVTPQGAPEYGRFASIAPSPLVDGTAYAINDGHYTGDNKPYVYVTHDFGAHWKLITAGLPTAEWARAIGADIRNKNLVYLGTEEGIWISYDGGDTWKSFKNGMPTVSVHDIRMQPQFDDLVIATHGRSIYVMDDMAPIQQLQQAIAAGTYLFPIRPSYQYNVRNDDEGTYTNYAAENPPTGAIISFYQSAAQKNPPKLEILDAHGRVIRTYQGTHKIHGKDIPYISNKVGINRFVWGWTIGGPVKWTGAARERYQGPNDGPLVPPGTYTARLTIGSKVMMQRFVVKASPGTQITQAQLDRSYAVALQGEAMFSQVDEMLNNLDAVKKSLDTATAAAKKANNASAQGALATIATAREGVFGFLTADYHNDEDSIERPGALREDLQLVQYLSGGVVTPAMDDYIHRLDGELRDGRGRYDAFVSTQLPLLNEQLKSLGEKPVTLTPIH
ncbi:MAG: glycosyl hydrolase [bacterium]|nr:glycosyl hydrolase [bacterium]